MLAPPPQDLGYASPQLGPWFTAGSSSSTPPLELPDGTLGVDLTLPDGAALQPPTAGTLSMHVPTADRLATRPFSHLHGTLGDGSNPVAPGRLVLVFRLLPEVEQRLDLLTTAPQVPPVEATSVGATAGPTRPRVRWFTYELRDAVPGVDQLAAWVRPAITDGDAATKAGRLGLRVVPGGLADGPSSMNDLKRPGDPVAALGVPSIGGGRESLLVPEGGPTNWTLRCFDDRGRPLDPGAVAAWWGALLGAFPDLAAPGSSGSSVVDTVAPGRTVHVTDPHEGPVDAAVRARVTLSNLTPAATAADPATATVLREQTAGGDTTVGFAAAPSSGVDDVPVPRVAALPAGGYGTSASLWPSTSTYPARDFVRVAVTDVERHLVGTPRSTTETGTAAAQEVAAQARASTRVRVGETASTTGGAPWLATTIDAGLAQLAASVGAASDGSRRLVTPTLDRATAPAAPGPGPLNPAGLPAELPAAQVVAIGGSGVDDGGIVRGQSVALVLDLGAAVQPGTWVRVWTTELDHATGRYRRGPGGGGAVAAGAAGRAVVVVPVLDGPPDGGDAPLQFDVALTDAADTRVYPPLRLPRPALLPGPPVTLTAAANVVVCETGAGLVAGRLPMAGVTVLASPDPAAPTPAYTAIDPSSIGDAQLPVGAVGAALAAGDVVRLTEPPWAAADEGDVVDGATLPATVRRHARSGLTRLVEAGAPPPGAERLEVVHAGGLAAGGSDAAVASAPLRARLHEVTSPMAGQPYVPAIDEVAGTAVRLTGQAAFDARELARDRTAGSTVELVADVVDAPLGARPAASGLPAWAAVLETSAFGVAAEPALDDALDSGYPTAGTYDDLRSWLAGRGVTIPAAADAVAEEAARALDRRIQAHARGAREAALSLRAAFLRAQDLVYLESPALDLLASGGDGSRVRDLAPLQVLRQRIEDVPSLHVVVCVPDRAPASWPRRLARVRDRLLVEALAGLRESAGEERFAAFHPTAGPGRSLGLTATTVVVDTAYLLTGTSHLWRRGMSWDASVAVAGFDTAVAAGRPASLVAAFHALLSTRLGVPVSLLHRDPAGLVDAVRTLVSDGGGGRTTVGTTKLPDPLPSDGDVTIWNPDGAPGAGLDPLNGLLALDTAGGAEIRDDLRPPP